MGRLLRWAGTILILTTVALWVGDMASIIPESTDDHWWRFTLKTGVLALGASLLLRVLRPVTKQIRKSRCTVCGHPTQHGHMYCLDHLQEAVNAGRDEARGRVSRPKTLL